MLQLHYILSDNWKVPWSVRYVESNILTLSSWKIVFVLSSIVHIVVTLRNMATSNQLEHYKIWFTHFKPANH